jgi:hypothetical protein
VASKNRPGIQLKTGRAWFDPQPDITVYELALCTQLMLSGGAGANRESLQEMWDQLPWQAERHFEVVADRVAVGV